MRTPTAPIDVSTNDKRRVILMPNLYTTEPAKNYPMMSLILEKNAVLQMSSNVAMRKFISIRL